ncbi:ABC transporter substrate-binding protein [Nocardioides marmoribigeumensis]|uniref:NitT/TauT family transport system substrate-binding protein n=1 Tax=Nocardioides marmoribigeumensis TaxID=433649 RepID=A0ABU2BVX3_9ACTN|nr:ABC transporter substrate-binding protein [Nocardioides marmoribigeumensis]MDR7362421.1 NitT/TauT family transport system substrate-binding protein [Nocardioides marmoribigeumensis]
MKQVRRRLGATLVALSVLPAMLSACGSDDGSSEGGDKSATLLMNWFAQAEQGGYWAADAEGLAKDDGVDIKVQQGGPGIQTVPQVTAGKAEFGVGNADEIMVAVENGLPIVVVASAFDENLQCMMFHKSTGISGFADLNGHMVARVPSPYWDYLKKEYHLDKVKDVNFTGSMADFKRNKDLVQQCYITAEPYVAKQQGINDVGYLSVAKDGGFNPYGNVLFTTEKLIKQDPDLVRAVVHASVKGWENFLDDPKPTKDLILKTNPDVDGDGFDYAHDALVKDGYLGDDIGGMTDDRWKTLRDQLASVDLVPADFDYKKAYTTEFLP